MSTVSTPLSDFIRPARPMKHADPLAEMFAEMNRRADAESERFARELDEQDAVSSLSELADKYGRAAFDAAVAKVARRFGYAADMLHDRGLDRLLADIDAA